LFPSHYLSYPAQGALGKGFEFDHLDPAEFCWHKHNKKWYPCFPARHLEYEEYEEDGPPNSQEAIRYLGLDLRLCPRISFVKKKDIALNPNPREWDSGKLDGYKKHLSHLKNSTAEQVEIEIEYLNAVLAHVTKHKEQKEQKLSAATYESKSPVRYQKVPAKQNSNRRATNKFDTDKKLVTPPKSENNHCPLRASSASGRPRRTTGSKRKSEIITIKAGDVLKYAYVFIKIHILFFKPPLTMIHQPAHWIVLLQHYASLHCKRSL